MNHYTFCNKLDDNIFDIGITKKNFLTLIDNLKEKLSIEPKIYKKKIYKNNGLIMDFNSDTQRVYNINSKFLDLIKNKNELMFIKEKREISLFAIDEINIYKDIDDEFELNQYIFNIDSDNYISGNIIIKNGLKIYFIEIESNNDSIIDYIDI
jgi:hypothetical protein